MYIYLLFIGWIVGISFMGHQIPQYFNLYLYLVIALNAILFALKWVKSPFTQYFFFKFLSLILFGLLSYFIGLYYADHALDKRLALKSIPQQQTEQIIYIASINKIKNKMMDLQTTHFNEPSTHFSQRVENIQKFESTDNFPQQSQFQQSIQQPVIVLNTNQQPIQMLMYINKQQAEMIKIGQYYRVIGQVKPIHGYAIEGTFDKERWFIQENILGILKTQNIESIDEYQVQQLGYLKFVTRQNAFFQQLSLKIENLRLHFRDLIEHSSLHNKGLLLALLTGDESLLSDDIQNLFKKLGISHLLAISGPHVLIFAAIFCFIFNWMIQRIYPQIYLKIPRPYLLVYPFLCCVIFYTAFVGFEIPALRTMLTIVILSLILLLKQKIQPFKHLLFTASLLLLIDPFSILSAAFWLSFGACLILIRVYQTIQQQSNAQIQTWKSKVKLYLHVLVASQWKTFIALLPLVLWIFQQFSWVTPFSNLIAIPMIGTLIVPIEVFAACISLLFEPLGLFLFKFSDVLLSLLSSLLIALDQLFNFKLNWWAFNTVEIICIALAVLILFLPRGVIPKFWALICILPVVFPNKNHELFQLNILDVGQGQAIFINLPDHKMMVDTGGTFDEKKFSVAKSLIIPFLMRQGFPGLDQVVLTHLDLDHSGAYTEVADIINIKKVFSNQKDQRFDHVNFEYCHSGQQWQYGNVNIQVLSPPENSLSEVPNNQNELSCVIYIQVPKSKQYQNFLLMGDVGWETEFRLLQQYPDLKVDVLVLGHHGSQHSSSYAFLKQLKPKLAIASAGFENRYGHPHPIVLKRLKELGIPLKTTIEQGSIEFNLQSDGQMKIIDFRSTRKWLNFSGRTISD